MARFRFNLRLAPARAASLAVVSQRTLAALNLLQPEPAAPAEAPQGPGWFDSSWELIRGLDVHEGAPRDLPLNHWLDACLRGGLAFDSVRAGPLPDAFDEVDAFSGYRLEGLELV